MATVDLLRHGKLTKCQSEIGADALDIEEKEAERLRCESAATLNPQPLLWDWPFNSNGVARCHVDEDEFSVQLDFSYLKNHTRKNGPLTPSVRGYDGLKNNRFSWQIGLAPTGDPNDAKTRQHPRDENNFWRLELQVLNSLNLIVIEACRQIGSGRQDGFAVRNMKKLRRVYKIPAEYDVNTLEMSIVANGAFLLSAKRAEKSVDVPGPKRKLLTRSESFA